MSGNRPKADEERDVFCEKCNRIAIARVKAVARGEPTTEAFDAIAPEDAILGLVAYKVALCVRCQSVFLIRAIQTDVGGEFVTPEEHDVLYPRDRDVLPEHVPASVRRAFETALSSFRAGLYEPCAIMCRKSLEALCRELGAIKGSLAAKITDLSDSGRIDRRLAEWAHELRLVGNDAAHDLDVLVSKDDAQDGLDFVEAILQNVFVLDHRFRALQARRRRASREPAAST